jgi:hypothetical protein
VFDHAFEVLVVADELEGGGGADAFDGVEVVTAEEDAKVDELVVLVLDTTGAHGVVLVTCSRSMPRPSSTLSM